jgi:predicted RNA binding protein YcfA (HicA-like mRNA interferase family)
MPRGQSPLTRLKKNKIRITFEELVALLADFGYLEKNRSGSHYIYGRSGSLPIMIVKPHGGKKYCHPMDVNKVIRLMESDQ